MASYNTLSDYYTANGGANTWNSAKRLADAQKAGIQNYTGTAEQNTQLLGFLTKPTTSTNNGLVGGSTTTNPVFSSGTIGSSGQVSLGVKAATPQNNITPSNPTVPQSMQAPTNITPPAIQSTSGGTTGSPTPPPPIVGTQGGSTATTGYPSTQTFDPSQYGLYGQLIAQVANRAQQPSPDYTAQIAEANKYNEALKQSRMNEAGALSANAQNPIPLEFQQGRGQVLQSQYAQEQNALAGAYQGAAGLAGQANTQQQIQQQGLGTAAAGAAPIAGQPYGYYNPAGQQSTPYGGGGTGAFSAGGVVGNQSLGTQQAVLQGVERQTSNLTDQLTSFLQQNPNINPGGLSVVNGLIQLGANQIGDPAYQTFQNLVNDLISKYSQILTPSGGNPTDMVRQIASSLINPNTNPQNIVSVLNGLKQQAQGVIGALNPNQQGGTQSGTTFGTFFGQ